MKFEHSTTAGPWPGKTFNKILVKLNENNDQNAFSAQLEHCLTDFHVFWLFLEEIYYTNII